MYAESPPTRTMAMPTSMAKSRIRLNVAMLAGNDRGRSSYVTAVRGNCIKQAIAQLCAFVSLF